MARRALSQRGWPLHAFEDDEPALVATMAEAEAYAGIGDSTGGAHKLSGAYLARTKADAIQRVGLAGARLSWLIQQNLR